MPKNPLEIVKELRELKDLVHYPRFFTPHEIDQMTRASKNNVGRGGSH